MDRFGTNYCWLTFHCNYDKQYVDISRPGYVDSALEQLQYKPFKSLQFTSHLHQFIKYVSRGTRQIIAPPDVSPLLSAKQTKYAQSVVDSFLYYARVLHDSIPLALNQISSMQAQPTFLTMSKCQQLLNSANTYKNMYIRYHASNMVLHSYSDAAYLVAPKSRSCIVSYNYLSNHPSKTRKPTLN